MPNFIIAKPGWDTPRTLARSLKVRRIKNDLLPTRGKAVNWGRTDVAVSPQVRCLNRPEAIARAANKLRTFELLKGAEVPTVQFTTDPQRAMEWAQQDKTVYGRLALSAREGKGIRLWGPKFDTPIRIEQFRGIGLFTKHWKCDYEARYHVFLGEVIDIQRKMRINREAFDQLPEPARRFSYWVRSHRNGWNFGREGVQRHPIAERVAISACAALGLDFGAVDIRIRGEKAVVLEVNSAPGLEGTTLEKYQAKLRKFFRV